MLPKFGATTNPVKDVREELRRIGEIGMDFAEITLEGPEGEPEILSRHWEEILSIANEYGIFFTAHAPWWCELGSLDKDLRDTWMHESRKLLDCCRLFGIRSLNFHINSLETPLDSPGTRKRVLDTHIKSLKELVSYAKKGRTQVLLENIPFRNLFTPDDMKHILDRVRGLGMTLDIAHAFVEGGFPRIQKYITLMDKKILHIHMGDNNGRHDEHLAIGYGKIPWEKVVKALKEIRYDKAVVLEVFSTKDKAVGDSMHMLRRIWKGQE